MKHICNMTTKQCLAEANKIDVNKMQKRFDALVDANNIRNAEFANKLNQEEETLRALLRAEQATTARLKEELEKRC